MWGHKVRLTYTLEKTSTSEVLLCNNGINVQLYIVYVPLIEIIKGLSSAPAVWMWLVCQLHV